MHQFDEKYLSPIEMMGDRAALLQNVLRDPDDDVARLVFADWLEENGHSEMAKYIRNEVAAKSRTYFVRKMNKWAVDTQSSARSVTHMLSVETELLEETRSKECLLVVGFSRGFISHVELTFEDFMRQFHWLYLFQPVVSVHFSDLEPYSVVERHLNSFRWFASGTDLPEGVPSNCILPKHLFYNLKSGTKYEYNYSDEWCWNFQSYQDAMDSLSQAAVNFGRQSVHLDPLP